jgi:hypothetical protein
MLFSGSLGDPCIFQVGKGEGDPCIFQEGKGEGDLSMLIVRYDLTCEL